MLLRYTDRSNICLLSKPHVNWPNDAGCCGPTRVGRASHDKVAGHKKSEHGCGEESLCRWEGSGAIKEDWSYKVCPEGIQPCNMTNRDVYWRRYKIQETLYVGQWHLNPFKVGTLGPHTVLPILIGCPVIVPWFSSMVWNLFPFKGDFSFGKSQKCQSAKSGLQVGWVTWMIWCFAKKLCTRHDAWVAMLSWWSCQSPVAYRCGHLNHPNSFCGAILKLNAKFDADPLLYLLSHFECDGHTVHMLIQCRLPPPLTSTVKSSLFMYVHSSSLSSAARLYRWHTNCSCYINNSWTFSG